MTLDEFFEIDKDAALGAHTFDAPSIMSFARKYDPQPFHTDEQAARKSVFGGLCASGWQTAATWMKRNVATPGPVWTGPGPAPLFGPSPGISDLKWPKPVFAGETINFSRTALSHCAVTSRPGWRMLSVRAVGVDSSGDKVLEFESSVLVQIV